MKKMIGKPKVLAGLAAIFWFLVGTRMLIMGMRSALKLTIPLQIVSVILFVLGVMYLKGFLLFGKMARENMTRLKTLAQPIPIYRIFPRKTYIFILVFAPSGITLGKFLVNPYYRSMILLSVGAALFMGGFFYVMNWSRVFGSPTDSTSAEAELISG